MPSPGEDIQSWSVTAANNGTADPLIVWSEGQARASVNNSSRSEMAAHAKNRNLLNGSIVTTGSTNAQQFLSGVGYTSIPTGLRATLKAGFTNTASMTLNMDGLGDVLVKTADGTNLLGGEFVANGYVDVIYNGTNWVFLYGREFFQELITSGGGIIIGKQVFDVAGSFAYTPTTGMECCIIECIGGGGGGGGASVGATNYMLIGGGGGGGGYSRKIATADDIGGSQPVVVGAGGAGDTGFGVATSGGVTSLGSLCVANGGTGGYASTASSSGGGGNGGAPGTGDLTAAGSPGMAGLFNASWPGVGVQLNMGQGGSSAFGGGAYQPTLGAGVNPGQTANKYGGGGSGGAVLAATGATSGGAGSAGVVIVTEFAGRGAPGRDGATGAAGPVGPAGPAGAGTGDVLRSGTPAAGQFAQWVDASHIMGVAAPTADFTTGDAKLTFKTAADTGWILCDDGSIGNAASGATTRANADTGALFTLLYNNITTLVVQDSTGATVARGANAGADFSANRRLVIPKTLGRALAVAGTGSGLTARTLGTTAGAETIVLTTAQLPAHSHLLPQGDSNINLGMTSGAGNIYGVQSNGTNNSTATSLTGSGSSVNIVDPTTYLNVMIKL